MYINIGRAISAVGYRADRKILIARTTTAAVDLRLLANKVFCVFSNSKQNNFEFATYFPTRQICTDCTPKQLIKKAPIIKISKNRKLTVSVYDKNNFFFI